MDKWQIGISVVIVFLSIVYGKVGITSLSLPDVEAKILGVIFTAIAISLPLAWIEEVR